MAKLNSPGIYTEEIPRFSSPVTEEASAVPAFIGYTEITEKSGNTLINNPLKINSITEFESIFGGISKKRIKSNPVFYLYHSLKLYFKNGGNPCYIISLGDFNSQPDKSAFQSALDELDKINEISLVLFPDAVCLSDSDLGEVQRYALTKCSQHLHRFCILDIKNHTDDLGFWEGIENFRQHLGTQNLKYGAAYTPWLQIHSTTPNYRYRKEVIEIPPSGAVAGIFCQNDQNRGVWKSPSSLSLSAVWDLSRQITAREQEKLNVDLISGKSINAIREFPGRGIRVWGGRTLAGNDAEWRYINVTRFRMFIRKNIINSTAWVREETNDAALWMKLKTVIENYLYLCWRNGSLAGIKPEDAFYVRCGLNQTMSQRDIDAGKLIAEAGISILRPAEFLIIPIEYNLA